MGKSLRSKSKLRAKSIKRKAEFSEYVDQRNKRISEKLIESTKAQEELKKQKKQEDGSIEQDVEEDDENATPMETDNNKKPSTSGWRNSRKQQYIRKNLKGKKKGKNATMKF